MKPSKLLTLLALVIVLTFLSVSSALAGGWHVIGTDHDPDAGKWANNSGGDTTKVPHLNLSTSSNNCRTCHAVHVADAGTAWGLNYNSNGSFKLLRDANRTEECNFCHGPSGALTNPVRKPYADMYEDDDGNSATPDVLVPAKGQHTLGALEIPDSNVDSSFLSTTSGLVCGNCHSVHGGWTLNGVTAAGDLNTRILRRDPAQNGNGTTGNGAADGVINVASVDVNNKPIAATNTNPLNQAEILAAFCGDCHNKNVNWDRGGSGAEGDSIAGGASEGERPNKFAHPLGKVDGLIDVYGKLGRVENSAKVTELTGSSMGGALTCWGCHNSRAQAPSKFPHQSKGHKLLNNSYTDTSTALDTGSYQKAWDTNNYTGDPNRPLPNLDVKVCRTCHGAGTAAEANGKVFPGIGVPNNDYSF